jgi:hypothetical protein
MRSGRIALYFAGAIILFNLWHISIRSFWPGSIMKAIGVGPNTIDLARQSFPDIEIKNPYDGQFCFAIAHDPLLITKSALPFVDVPVYRYRRMLYPLLAWMFSVGQIGALPLTLFLINILSWVAVGVATWRIARMGEMPMNAAVVGVMTVTGLQFAATRTLTEPLALSLILWGIRYLLSSRWARGFFLLGLAVLARETSVIVFASAAVYFCLTRPEHRRDMIGYSLLALVPALLWNLYLPQRLSLGFHPFAVSGGPGLTLPFVGFIQETRVFMTEAVTRTERIRTGAITFEALFLMCVSVVLLWRRPSVWSVLAVAEAVFCSLVRGEVWNFYAGSSRAIINLTVFVLFCLLTPSPTQADIQT